jgi:hypothetical protein
LSGLRGDERPLNAAFHNYIEITPTSLPSGMARDCGGWMICRWLLFFILFSLSFTKKYRTTLFIVGISVLVFILFMSNFCYWPFFIKVLYIFNLVLEL